MKISIKRGTKEIGGSAVEFTADNRQRLLVDIGLPLDALENTASLLPDVQGLTEKTDDLCAILISHAHQDHYALGVHIDENIPVYMGKDTASIMKIACQHHVPNAFEFKKVVCFEDRKPFEIGAFRMTPYLVDHSAYDAYAFLIEADGKKVFYSGDFRAHGRKGKLFDYFLKNKPQDIDVLLLEGSCLGREHSEKYVSEAALEKTFDDFAKECKGVLLVHASAQNIDRIVTLYRTAKKNDRTLVLSGYAGHVLWGMNNPHLPSFTWKDVKKMTAVLKSQHEVDVRTILQNPQKYVVLLNYRIFKQLQENNGITADTSYVYSMWDGYKKKYEDVLAYLKSKNVTMKDIHTSGHADIATLKKMVKELAPKTIVPIHTFYPQQFTELFENVSCKNDNETFDV